eukprot:3444461-Pyramimonas_sp.AAC.1
MRREQRPALLWLRGQSEKLKDHGGFYIIENPHSSDIWKESPLSGIADGKRCGCQCGFGCTLPSTKEPIKKPT